LSSNKNNVNTNDKPQGKLHPALQSLTTRSSEPWNHILIRDVL